MPIHTSDGATGESYAYRPDRPRLLRGKTVKYECLAGAPMRLDVPPMCRADLGDPAQELYITEGIKKGDALATHSLCAIDLLGVWNFKGRNEFGGVTLLADFDHIALKGRSVRIVYDSDVMTKKPVAQALARLAEHLRRKGANVDPIYLPHGENGTKIGVDDYLLAHPVEELHTLIGRELPAPLPAAPEVEWVEEAPPAMTKPLCFIAGNAYAATWIHVRTKTTESLNEHGEIVRYAKPRVETSREICVVRDDGEMFGAGKNSLEDLGFEISLDAPPDYEKLWSMRGVLAYAEGTRPGAANAFDRLVSVYDVKGGEIMYHLGGRALRCGV